MVDLVWYIYNDLYGPFVGWNEIWGGGGRVSLFCFSFRRGTRIVRAHRAPSIAATCHVILRTASRHHEMY